MAEHAGKHWKSAKWTGHYVQDEKKHPVTFEEVLMHESHFHTSGKDEIGKFVIQGVIDDDDVKFTKTYLGGRTVHYHGKLDHHHHTIKGKWKIGDSSDDFCIKIEHMADGTEHAKKTFRRATWAGHYVQSGKQHPVSYEEIFTNGKDFHGVGTDEVGRFVIQGSLEDDNDVHFTKTYVDAHSVTYHGKLGDDHTIKGHWKIGDIGDDFCIKIEHLH